MVEMSDFSCIWVKCEEKDEGCKVFCKKSENNLKKLRKHATFLSFLTIQEREQYCLG